MDDYTLHLFNLFLYASAVLILTGGMIGLSYVLGGRHRERATGEPYESGITATGSARLRFPVRYYIIAMFFVIFDLETVFLASWAISVREAGWAGFSVIILFLALLLSVLLYIVRNGAFRYAVTGREILKTMRSRGGGEES